MNAARTSDSRASAIDRWLESLGLEFDPFRALNAGEDARIYRYLVAHEAFEAIRRDQVSFVFAPPGGGKTAFRVRLARACRMEEEDRRIFPVVHLIPENVILSPEDKRWDAHLQGILWGFAFECLLRLAYRPREFLRLPLPQKREVRTLLGQGLPGRLEGYLEALDTSEDLQKLARLYDPTAQWAMKPDQEALRAFRQALLGTEPLSDKAGQDMEGRFNEWIDLLLGPLEFEAIYLLVDGVDAYPETAQDAEQALGVLKPLLERASGWQERRLFLKGFLQEDLASPLKEAFPSLTSGAKLVRIQWTPKLLRRLIQRRMEAALNLAPAGLGMLCDRRLRLRGVEDLVVEAVEPSPREVLVFVERMFYEHVQRAGPGGRLTLEDLAAARRWYEQDRGPVRSL